jgi:thiamine pyrophosphate-dependent acetolactate synthase large subunit-like protein
MTGPGPATGQGPGQDQVGVLLVTIGRQLDYQLGFGSPAVFPNARVLRISDTASELIDNRRGDVEILAGVATTLGTLADALAGAGHPPDTAWRDELRARHLKRAAELARRTARQRMAPRGATSTVATPRP